MKPSSLLLFPALGLPLLVSPAQQAPPALQVTTPTTWEADWAGEPGRVYFAEWSADLENWVYLPTMKFGEEMHGIGAEVSEGKGFLRLNYYDDPTLADLDAAKAADFDDDGISNWDEVTGTSTNPTNGDTDGDTLPDGWETAHGLDPNDDGSTDPQNGANGSFQGSQTTNGSAHSQGVQANSNATLDDHDADGLTNGQEAIYATNPQNPDSDGDGQIDSLDGWAMDANLQHPRLSKDYVLVDLSEHLPLVDDQEAYVEQAIEIDDLGGILHATTTYPDDPYIIFDVSTTARYLHGGMCMGRVSFLISTSRLISVMGSFHFTRGSSLPSPPTVNCITVFI